MNKYVVEGLFTVLLCTLLVTGILGILTKQMRNTFSSDLTLHKTLAYAALVLYLLSIIFTEVMVRTHGGQERSLFLPFHLFFAVVSLAAFLAALWYNGERRREWHRPLVYTCITTYVIAFVLAIPLLRLF